jgi:hypothetical protein
MEWLETGFWLVIEFIEHLQIITTNNYDSLIELHTPKINHGNCSTHKVLSVFTSRCLLAAFNGGRSPFSGFQNCPRPQLPASHFSQLQLSAYSTTQAKVQVMLRPTVSRPVCLRVKQHVGPKTRFLLLSDSCMFVHVWRPLWREDGSVVDNCCWSSPAQPYLPWSKSVVHVTYSYIYNLTCRHSTESAVKSPVPCGHLLFTGERGS